MKRTLLIILTCIIAIPFLLIAGYLSYSYSVDAYARHTLKKAAPDFKKVVSLHPIMFQLTKEVAEFSRSQNATLKGEYTHLTSQIASIDMRGRHLKYLPYCFL